MAEAHQATRPFKPDVNSSILILSLLCMTLLLPMASSTLVHLRPCLDADADSVAASASGEGSNSASHADALFAMAEEEAEKNEEHAKNGRRAVNIPQSFKLDELIVQWDSWTTSQMVTAAAAIVLSERLGFNVRLESGRTSKQAYKAISKGELHAAFEAWPMSNLETYRKYVLDDGANSSVASFSYSTLFGRSGIFETCSRSSMDASFSKCSGGFDTEPILDDALQTEEGRRHFQNVKQLFSVQHPDPEEWSPRKCAAINCSLQLLHIAKKGYDEGAVESLVEQLGLPAKVVYLGEANHTQAIWKAYTKRAGALVYSYYPNTNQFGISVLDLPRAQILPVLDFKPQRLEKLAWKGLRQHRGGDALAFIQGWDLQQEDYQELGRLFDLLGDAQAAACTWVKENTNKWEHLVKFPERRSAPFFCAAERDWQAIGLCTETRYIVGWILFFAQLVGFVIFVIISMNLVQPRPFAEDGRAALEQAWSDGNNINKTLPWGVHGSFHPKRTFFSALSDRFVKRAGNYHTRVEFTRQVIQHLIYLI